MTTCRSAPERLEGLPSYWILGQEKTACLRPNDQLLRKFETPGKWLGECGASGG